MKNILGYSLLLFFTGININSIANADNAIPLKGFANGWTHFFDGLKSYMNNDPGTYQQLATFLGKDNTHIRELLDPLEKILNETSRFGTALENVINSTGLQQFLNNGDIVAGHYLGGLGVSHACFKDLKLIIDGIINRKDWALRSKFIVW